ncbi:MAG: hypothetical protein KatS3mg115_0015 [Candidatus Poribacteria bacterium]|nr:MAG: hypothetical protein KatS3mg115_0015 [Candidatus Poribacteria bacterium]
MGGVAASGGYYVAMAADRIVAEPATLTGSIGVWGGKFALTGLYRKLGIRQQVLTRGQNATIWSDRPLSDSERERLQALIRNVYDEFLQKASKSRNRSLEEIEAVGPGAGVDRSRGRAERPRRRGGGPPAGL